MCGEGLQSIAVNVSDTLIRSNVHHPLTSHKSHELLNVHPSALLLVEAEGQTSHVSIGQLDIAGLHCLKDKEREG